MRCLRSYEEQAEGRSEDKRVVRQKTSAVKREIANAGGVGQVSRQEMCAARGQSTGRTDGQVAWCERR